ncbi:MAG: zinc metalloprotease HtpX, partial [Chloroflexi bacterium]
YVVQMGFWFGMIGGGGGRDNNRDGGGISFIAVILISLVVSVISQILVSTLSRYREFAADRGSAILTGAPEQLEAALLRISGTMQRIPSRDLREAQPLSALYFASPAKVVGGLFADHPTVEKRIERLQQLSQNMAAR